MIQISIRHSMTHREGDDLLKLSADDGRGLAWNLEALFTLFTGNY